MRNPVWFRIRALLQLALWFFFIFTVIYTRDPVVQNPFSDLYPRLSIHLGITASILAAKVLTKYLPAIVILFTALVFGRFFCSTICPLGATLDISDRIFRKKHKMKSGDTSLIRYKSGKFVVLLVSILMAVFGLQTAGIIDPLSLSVRSYGTALYSYFDFLVKSIMEGLYHIPIVNSISEPIYSFFKRTILDFNPIMFLNHTIVFMLFLLILILSLRARRFWCQVLCPLGAFFALTGRLGIFKRSVDGDKCVNCLKCQQNCRMDAIHDNGLQTFYGECIQCFECLKSCSYDANEFKIEFPLKKKRDSKKITPQGTDITLTRRSVFYGLLASSILIPFARLNPLYAKDSAGIIRPPGALPEKDFLDTCIRCGECMKVCPTNALHPALFESGIEGIFTPRLVPKIGWCEKNCNQCTLVCPTGALKKLKIEDKETTFIGTAYILRDLCIPWAEQRNCIVCEEVCPTVTKAIIFRESYTNNKKGKRVKIKFPIVLEDLCIGCGICENKCPVPGNAAIRVRAKKTVGEDKLAYPS